MRARSLVQRARRCAAIVAAAAVVRCGSPMQPGEQPAPSVFAITPATGPMSGGTSVQISGSNFAAGAQVTVGGAAGTDVVVTSPTTISAKTPPRASTGAADVTVTVAGKAGTLPGGFSYQVDPGPPVIDSITAQGTRPNEPAGFADIGEEIAAKVTDPDTPIDQLQFEWTADLGTFTGTGANVMWRAPGDARTPLPVAITLKVTDNLGTASSTTTISLHNSIKEVGDLARGFLLDFSDSSKPTDYVMRNFSTSPRCVVSRNNEFDDVTKNRTFFKIEKSAIGDAKVNVQFSSFPCSYNPINGDACAVVRATWDSLCLVTNPECKVGEHPHADGLDYVTEVYESAQWRLCASEYQGLSGIHFMR